MSDVPASMRRRGEFAMDDDVAELCGYEDHVTAVDPEVAIRADERAKCIAEIEALRNELHAVLWEARRTGGLIQMTDAVIVALSAALSVTNQPEDATLRSLSPLGLPTTEREQKK